MGIKIAMIGAGSIGFTRALVRDVLAVPELADTTFSLMDISQRNLDMVTQLCERDIQANGVPARIIATTHQREAIEGADYILCTIRQGGMEAFQTDIDIPLKYGVDQCVGDTISAGGLMYAQRTIPVLLEICKDIREVAKPGALFLNYANPMAMNTWACLKYGGVETLGLCHGVQGGHWQITRVIELWAKREGLLPEDYKMHRDEVDIIAAGINHQTWYIKVEWRGMDMRSQLWELFQHHPYFPQTEKVRLDVLKRFGYYSTESNGHLSEYLPWYRKRPNEINDWIDLSSWINGETGGYLRVCTEGRNWFETDFPNWLKEPAYEFRQEKRSEEHGSFIIEGLETGRIYRGHFNVMNKGHIPNLPDGSIIEIPGYVDRTGVHMPVVGNLPLACAATCAASIRVQEMGM
ncbi:MAG: alpha-galactosidase, partial [bacterium]|nr:alpha-galactosidase [bacterium]